MFATRKSFEDQLSVAQRGVWVAQKLNPASPIFNLGQYIEIRGEIDAVLLRRALFQVIEEAPSLRIAIRDWNGEPSQTVRPSDLVDIPIVDFSSVSGAVAEAQQWMRDDLRKLVDLGRDHLFSFAILRISPRRALWYQRYHHIANDGFGGWLVTRRAADVYTALSDGKLPAETPFAPFTQLLAEERDYRASDQFASDRKYWMERLTGAEDPPRLCPAAAGTAAVPTRHTAYLARPLTAALRTLTVESRASLTQVLTAALAAYLFRLTGSTDVSIGLAVTGRMGRVLRQVPGMLSDVLPLRMTLSPQLTFGELLQRVAGEFRRTLRHQRYRSEDIRKDLDLTGEDRKLYGPMVNAMPFDYDLHFGECSTVAHNLANGPVDDLAIAIYEQANTHRLRIDFDANPASYTGEQLAGLERRFARCLSDLRPEKTVASLTLLEPEEQRRVVTLWNRTRRASKPGTLPALIEAEVAQRPSAPAVVFEDTTLTYAELEQRANRVAHWLIARSIGPESCVALAAPRSIEMVVGLVGILKSGAAYLPLDPEYPLDRLTYMLEDARPAALLTVAAIVPHLPPFEGHRLVLDGPEDLKALTGCRAHSPASSRLFSLDPRHPAYIIYTSGSTGRPKAVVNTHAGIVNRLCWMQGVYGLTAADRVLQKTPYSFDVSVWEFFWPLLTGATLVLARPDGHRDPAYLSLLIRREKITTIHFVPSMLRAFLSEPSAAQCTSLRRVIASGEALPGELQADFERVLKVPLHNLYGPTEAAVDVSYWECPRDR